MIFSDRFDFLDAVRFKHGRKRRRCCGLKTRPSPREDRVAEVTYISYLARHLF